MTEYTIFPNPHFIYHFISHLQHIPRYRQIFPKKHTICILYSVKSQTCLSLGLSASDVNPSHTFYRIHHFFQIHTLSVILPVIYSIFQDTDRQSPKRQKLCHSVFCKKTDASQTIRSASVQLLFCHFLFSPFSPKYQPSIILPVIYSTFQDTDRSSQKTNILYSKKDRSSQTCLSLGLSASDANPSRTFYRLYYFIQNTLRPSSYQSFTAHFKIQTYNLQKTYNL
jgi:hypothetical protein